MVSDYVQSEITDQSCFLTAGYGMVSDYVQSDITDQSCFLRAVQ